MTSPRRRTNQRLATMAANTSAIDPVPSPISTPHSRTSCQLLVTPTLRPLPAAISSRATLVTARTPNRSMRAAANGAVSPNSTRLTPTASETRPRDQPNSSSSGTMSTPGAARKPAAHKRATKATPAATHAGCSRAPRAVATMGGPPGLLERSLPGAAAERGVQRIRHTHRLAYSFLRHCGLSLW